MPRSREFLPVDEAIRILEDSGYRVERHGRLYDVCDPYGTTNFYKVASVRMLARQLWLSVGVLHNLQRSGLTTQHPGATIYP